MAGKSSSKSNANGSTTLSLANLQSQPENDRLDLTTPDGATGCVYIKSFNAGIMLDSTALDAEGKPVVDMSVLLEWIVYGVVDENGEPIFDSVEQIKALAVSVYSQLTKGVLDKLAREQTLVKGKDETEATAPTAEATPSATASSSDSASQ